MTNQAMVGLNQLCCSIAIKEEDTESWECEKRGAIKGHKTMSSF